MSKYFVKVTSELQIDNDDDLKIYLQQRQDEWGDDQPEEVERLIKTGLCRLQDEDGTTTIQIMKVEEENDQAH